MGSAEAARHVGTSEFDAALALTERVPGSFVGDLTVDWWMGGGIHPGLLLALAARALAQRTPGHPHPLSISAYFLTGAREGGTVLDTEIIRRDRTLSHGTVALSQRGDAGSAVERMRALAVCGDLGTRPDAARPGAPAPRLPPPGECAPFARPRTGADLLDRLDLRLDPATSDRSTEHETRAWLSLADGREPDPCALLMALDALPPAGHEPGRSLALETTAYVVALPAPGRLRLVQRTRHAAEGRTETDAELWDASGRSVARSRRLARTR